MGGDKPRPYRQGLTQQVGAGFIPARESAWLGNDFHLEIAHFRFYFHMLPALYHLLHANFTLFSRDIQIS